MEKDTNLKKHKAIIKVLLELLPHAIPRYRRSFLIYKKENKLNSLVSELVGYFYLNDINKISEVQEQDEQYKKICEAYDYILNVVDAAGVKYDKNIINNIKINLNID
jgi:ArsR family metal-binding transcriptional regulator